MAKIDTAYSFEANDVIDAIEANELWLEGILKDKRAFKCIDENCDARITCKNMDTFADKRKVNPHFIMSSRENMHSPVCKVCKEYEEKISKRGEIKGEGTGQYISKKVCFHMERPERHRIIEHNVINNEKNNVADIEGEKKKNRENGKRHNSNYYWLHSLILYYVDAYKKGTTEQDTVEIDFGRNKKYTYFLNSLFKRIKNENEVSDRDRNHYVYYGKGKVFLRSDGGYDLVFSEKFFASEKRVKCIIKKIVLDTCMHGKANKLNILESAIGKERFIYVLSSKNINPKYNTVFLNIKNLDCVAISEIDLDSIERMSDDDEEYFIW